jgi:hypothetical protein
VTITGTSLTNATAVTFGSTAATFTVTNATHIDATAPAENAGTVHVTVTTAGGTSATGNADQYTYTPSAPPAPTVTQISPDRGPAAGGTKVTITGTNLSGATSVSFGAHPATGVTVTDAGHLTVTAPRGTAASTVDVKVTTSGGASTTGPADRYHYLARPRVTSLSLVTGTRAGGTKLVITGSGFTTDAVVRFGTKVASMVTVTSSTRIVVRSPAHRRGTVDVAVVTGGGTSARVRADRFRYV